MFSSPHSYTKTKVTNTHLNPDSSWEDNNPNRIGVGQYAAVPPPDQLKRMRAQATAAAAQQQALYSQQPYQAIPAQSFPANSPKPAPATSQHSRPLITTATARSHVASNPPVTNGTPHQQQMQLQVCPNKRNKKGWGRIEAK